MNLLLLDAVDAEGRATIGAEAVAHVRTVLGKGVGDSVRVGVLGGTLGEATIEAHEGEHMRLRCTLGQPPPPKRPFELVLALPRPPVLRRVLQHATTMGVARIVLCNAARVEKSYWSSPALAPGAIFAQLRLGLEQARDTIAPAVELRPRLRPFVEDELARRGDAVRLLADGSGATTMPCDLTQPAIVAIGPEGGWVEFELALLAAAGFTAVTLGPRALRVEAAVVAALARLG
ncbi:MAG: 16S rRNA (uracil(1498)-N(3))-methyltransferase [Nannocystaceae bacterium]|nr:16S rRNA (uracil(1498)-N(3))-methyltransferase [Nannocystaceae bacterium]